ncbi:AAA family ATPase [Nocardia arizonensis]|uniref:AAA family ATPase n=1 Tax=Nocardia arizonensis TaxID=1141647 RepID=UPI000AC4CE56|nr:AAA family ATPase [Nocardia arizonensis]
MTILTGPPGAGKTTVAERLAADAAVPTAHLTTDLFYRSIRSGFVLPYLPEAHRQNEVVIAAIVGTVVTFARGGYDVVVDGIVGPWFLPPFRAATELKDTGAITGLYAAFADLGQLEKHVSRSLPGAGSRSSGWGSSGSVDVFSCRGGVLRRLRGCATAIRCVSVR